MNLFRKTGNYNSGQALCRKTTDKSSKQRRGTSLTEKKRKLGAGA